MANWDPCTSIVLVSKHVYDRSHTQLSVYFQYFKVTFISIRILLDSIQVAFDLGYASAPAFMSVLMVSCGFNS